MGLTERRIGLLFAIFLGLLVIAVGRTFWLGGVQASSLRKAAATQQVDEIVVPARRGAISDRNGVELAVSQPAADVAATPYLVKHPARVAAQLAPLLDRTQAEVPSRSSEPRAASSTSRATWRARRPRRSASSTSRGCSSSRPRAATTRASGWRRRRSAASASTVTA